MSPLVLAVLMAAGPARGEDALAQAHALYFRGESAKTVAAYQRAAKSRPEMLSVWLNGAVVFEELGRGAEALAWYKKAAAISGDAETLSALGWCYRRLGRLKEAAGVFRRALARENEHALALLGAGRTELELGRPAEAVRLLERARSAAPLYNLPPFYLGRAHEALGDRARALAAYRAAVAADSYFNEGRDALGRAYMRSGSYQAAYRQFAKASEAEPKSPRMRGLLDRIRPLLTRSSAGPSALFQPIPFIAEADAPNPKIPVIRVGINADAGGKPRPRQSLRFKVTVAFDLRDARTGKKLLEGQPEQIWQLRVIKPRKGRAALAIADLEGKTAFSTPGPVIVSPHASRTGAIALEPAAERGGGAAGKLLRGALELGLWRGQIRLVNIIDLENYTHGVVSAEMPIKSPLEALKAQAVMARTHALFIKQVYKNRHKHEGYDLCDEQHCQVYKGLRAESQRSREVVDGTRGKILEYRGRVAHVIYMSNCGGHSQNGRDLTGWSDVPYLAGIPDGQALARPQTPWELRRWLTSWPQAYCKPSNDVHPTHFRWQRVIPFSELSEKVDRKLKTGKLQALRTLRRSRSGNVNAIQLIGSKRTARVDSEIQIRGLLGIGSLRSTLFFVDVELGADGRPESLVFHGGGWGHGVGLCQSGAMGRAEAGQNFEQIVTGYFKGSSLGDVRY